MGTPTNRTPVRVARGSTTALNTGLSDIQEGEIVWDTTQNKLQVKEGSVLEDHITASDPAKADVASPVFTGSVTIPAGASIAGYAPLVSPTFTTSVDIDGATQIDATVTVGVDGTGYDVKFFGNTSGKYCEWDTSLNRFTVTGDTVVNDLNATGDVGCSTLSQLLVAVSAAATALTNTQYSVDTSTAAFTLTLPASPTIGDYVAVMDAAGSWATNNLTVAQNGSNIMGAAQDLVCNTNYSHATLIYSGNATTGWVVT